MSSGTGVGDAFPRKRLPVCDDFLGKAFAAEATGSLGGSILGRRMGCGKVLSGASRGYSRRKCWSENVEIFLAGKARSGVRVECRVVSSARIGKEGSPTSGDIRCRAKGIECADRAARPRNISELELTPLLGVK